MNFKWTPRLGLALLWTAAIVLASSNLFSSSHSGGLLAFLLQALHISLPDETLAGLNHVLRKTGHLSAYALLALLWDRALAGQKARHQTLIVLMICLGVASWDEWHQSLLPSRTGTPVDVGIDMLGAGSLLLLRRGWQFAQKRTQRVT